MKLDGHTFAQALRDGKWKAFRGDKQIGPEDLTIGSNSVNVTLGNRLLKPLNFHGLIDLDPVDTPERFQWDTVEGDKHILRPGEFCLGFAQERFEVHEPLTIWHTIQRRTGGIEEIGQETYFVPMFEGRSTCGRLGIATHITAGFGDYHFGSNFTMELQNVSPNTLVLTTGMEIAQLHFDAVTPGVVNIPYKGAYANRNGGPHAPVLGRSRFFKA